MKKINILVPNLPESVNDATVIKWYKKEGDIVKYDDNIVDIETDKVMLEVSSPCNGTLKLIIEKEGNIVKSQQILGEIYHCDNTKNDTSNNFVKENKSELSEIKKKYSIQKKIRSPLQRKTIHLTPSQRRLNKINHSSCNFINNIHVTKESKKILNNVLLNDNICNKQNHYEEKNTKFEHRIPMSKLRKIISERLLNSQKNTAMLTTFNEVNMHSIICFRKKYGKDFEKKYGIRIGFMSFFVKAVVEALKQYPQINASIDKTDIVYYKNYDISIAVSTPYGLITPVLRNAEHMTIPEIEKKIKEFSIKANEKRINPKELIGGNFTITNGGVFGSLMSTPIINPPQTAILGMHVIQERPVVVNGSITILPMMYLALSYDHCLIDGKESVGFLLTIKHILEDVTRILINI